jgi:hypothetical protein
MTNPKIPKLDLVPNPFLRPQFGQNRPFSTTEAWNLTVTSSEEGVTPAHDRTCITSAASGDLIQGDILLIVQNGQGTKATPFQLFTTSDRSHGKTL